MSTLTLQQPADQIRGLIRNPWVKGILIALAVSLLALFLADSAHAAATGASDFNTLYDRLRGWCGGSLGKALSLGFLVVGLAGGLIRSGYAAAAFMEEQPGVLPIWGIQYDWELDQFLDCVKKPPEMTEEFREMIARDREELSGDFCRGCGYCMPCPVGIEINNCARISLMLRRASMEEWLTPEYQAKMEKIKDCLHCNQCVKKCPYGLDTPRLLEQNYADYRTYFK